MSALPITRRHLLGGGLLLAGGWVYAQAFGHRGFPALDSPFLGTSGHHTLQAALEALLPRPEDAVGMADDVDAFLAAGDPVLGGQLVLGLTVLEHTGGAGPFSFNRFSRLPIARRALVLEGWRRSILPPRRQIADALRRIAFFTLYARPSSWEAIGYDGPMVMR